MDEFHRQLIHDLRAEVDRLAQREKQMLDAMLTGTECQIQGRRARVRVEWLDEPTILERVKAAIAAHEPEDGYLQWYVDEFCIDVDAGEFWRVVARALAEP